MHVLSFLPSHPIKSQGLNWIYILKRQIYKFLIRFWILGAFIEFKIRMKMKLMHCIFRIGHVHMAWGMKAWTHRSIMDSTRNVQNHEHDLWSDDEQNESSSFIPYDLKYMPEKWIRMNGWCMSVLSFQLQSNISVTFLFEKESLRLKNGKFVALDKK